MTDPRESAAAKTARERLEQTRRALLRHMSQDGEGAARASAAAGERMRDDETAADDEYGYYSDEAGQQGSAHGAEDGLSGAWQNIRQTAGAWWQSHPAHLALEVAQPVFHKYAAAHPVRVLALSAATGAALILIRPWRVISVTGLLVAAVKSTQMSALASAMLRPKSSEPMRRHEAERMREQERERWRQAQAAAQARDRQH